MADAAESADGSCTILTCGPQFICLWYDARRRQAGDLQHQLGARRLLELIALVDRDDEGAGSAEDGLCFRSAVPFPSSSDR
jgi:hypothetical protein